MTPNFPLEELTASDYATRHGIKNDPDAAALRNLDRLAETLEQVRAAVGDVPVNVSSGYRSPILNRAVGGSGNSAHMRGLAADFTARRFGSPRDVAGAIIAAGIEFDQLIVEGDRWVHLGLSSGPARGEVLTATFTPRGVSYAVGLV